MIRPSKYKQYGDIGLEVKGITLHNTSNYEMTAREIHDWLNNECKTNQGCHFLVDDVEVIQVMPLTYHVWHTGNAYDFGNMNTIAIEIVSIQDTDRYLQAEQKAMELVNTLANQYELTKDDIYFHCDFLENFNCPANILSIYGNKKNFIEHYYIERNEL